MRQRKLGQLIDTGDGDVGVVELRHHLQHPAAFLAQHLAQGVQLLELCETAGHRVAVGVHVDEAGGQADGAVAQALAQQGLHGRDLVGRRGALLGVGAHDPKPDHAVAYQGRDVDRQVGLDGGAVAGEVLPGPLGVLLGEGLGGHFLDLLEHADHDVAVRGAQRRQGQGAVAGDYGGHPMLQRRAGLAVPQKLGVEVGVRVDEPRRHHAFGRVDGAPRLAGDGPDLDDLAVLDRDIGPNAGPALAINNQAISDYQIVHG